MSRIGWKGGQGVNKDQPPTELALGVYSDCNNFRFRNGSDEKMGGIAEILATPSAAAYGLWDFQTTTNRFVVEIGLVNVYAHNGTTRYNITYIPPAVEISSIVDSTPSTTRLVTTATPHLLTTGDVVTISGCTGGTATDYNETDATITVLSSTTFSYLGGGATNPGGVDPGSDPVYTVTSSTSGNFTGTADDKVTGGHLAGNMIINHPINGLRYWTGDTSTDMVTFSITNYVADVGRPFRDWFVQLAPTISSVKYPRRVLWSAAAEPGSLPASFVASSTNDAGNVELDDTNGFLIDFLPLGDVAHIYKDDQRYAMQWIGGNDVFRFTPVHDASGLMARNCIANTTDGRQVFLTKSCDIRIHNGGQSQSIAEGRIRQYLLGDIDSTYKSRAFLATNPYTKEIWVFYPRSGQSSCNGVLVWNYVDDTWAIAHRGLSFTAAMDGLLPTSIATDRRLVVGTITPKLGLVDSGTTDLGATITATLERTGLHAEKRRQKKTLHNSSVDVDATSTNTASIYHGSHARPDVSASYGSAVTYTQGTTRDVNSFANSAEHMAWKLSTTATDWKQRSVEIEYTEDGEF